jgi:hypothetical protein
LKVEGLNQSSNLQPARPGNLLVLATRQLSTLHRLRSQD